MGLALAFAAQAGCHGTSASAADAGAAGACAAMFGDGALSQWVYYDASGNLQYTPLDDQGDRIMDYSHAGYMAGGVALPTVPAATTVMPSGADDTAAIQAALDAVAPRTPLNGVRGAVVLAPGVFHTSAPLQIGASGVVLRGSGSGAQGTEIRMTGPPFHFLAMTGTGSWALEKTAEATVTDAHVPTGATTLTVDDASAFRVGDTVLVRRPVTQAWVHFMGMDQLVRNGVPETWLSTTTLIPADRTIAAIDGNRVTLDVPLSDSYDATYVSPPGATIVRYSFAGRIEQVGLERVRVVAPALAPPPPIDQPLFTLLRASAVRDGWMRDVVALETENSVALSDTVKRFTIDELTIRRSVAAVATSGYPLEVQIGGTQILVERSTIAGDNLYTYTTVSRVTGPNVVLASTATGVHTRLEPHERWATGFLADGVVHDDRLDLVNRGTAGSGHGWAIGWGVLWNSAAAIIDVEKPPGATNWSIGSRGAPMGDGTFDSTGTPVAPHSLYLAQLCERLGPQAVANTGVR
ncbi:MAG TPA: hypothetical protein VKE22_27880 [Haliangiales bacterium]|nr:hypothetical protein [Haliangiales bacterium]